MACRDLSHCCGRFAMTTCLVTAVAPLLLVSILEFVLPERASARPRASAPPRDLVRLGSSQRGLGPAGPEPPRYATPPPQAATRRLGPAGPALPVRPPSPGTAPPHVVTSAGCATGGARSQPPAKLKPAGRSVARDRRRLPAVHLPAGLSPAKTRPRLPNLNPPAGRKPTAARSRLPSTCSPGSSLPLCTV